MALEEEIDMLKVQSSQDAATLHELKMALEQERDSKNYIAVACVTCTIPSGNLWQPKSLNEIKGI